MSELRIPIGTYTAYRLRYCTAEEMSRDAAVVSLGPIPKAWILDKKSVLLASIHRLNGSEHIHSVNGKPNGFLEIDSKRGNAATSDRATKHRSNGGHQDDSKTNRQSATKDTEGIRNRSRSLRRRLKVFKSKETDGKVNRDKEEAYHLSGNKIEKTDHPPKQRNDLSRRSSYQSLFPDFNKDQSVNDQARKFMMLEQSLFQSIMEPDPDLASEPAADQDNIKSDNTTDTIPPPQENCELDLTKEQPLPAYSADASKPAASNTTHRHPYTPEMLNDDIEEAKKKLQQQRSSGLDDDQFSISSEGSFVTAKTELSNGDTVSKEDFTPTVGFLGLENNDKRLANYNSVRVKKAVSSKGSYFYSFESKKLPLRKVSPSPCKDVDISLDTYVNENTKKSIDTTRHRSSISFVSHNQEKYKKNMLKLFEIYDTGAIIKMSKVLVLVTAEPKRAKAMLSDTRGERIMERWREYLVVARSTGNVDFPTILQFYKTNRILKNDETRSADRDIAKEIEQRLEKSDSDSDFDNLRDANAIDIKRKNHKKFRGRSCHFELIISHRDSKVGFHRLLDKSIRLTKEHTSTILNYTLVMNSTNAAISWINFLKLITSQAASEIKDTVFLKIPSLNISFTINKLASMHKSFILNQADKQFLLVNYKDHGYDIAKVGFTEMVLTAITPSLNRLYMQKNHAKDTEMEKFISYVKDSKRFLALALRKFDRLEWLVGDYKTLKNQFWNILGSYYEIELREFVHDEFKLEEQNIVEPAPVEGFIVKLSNRKGKMKSKLGNHYFKLLYAYTSKNLLFFQNFYKAVPVFANDLNKTKNFISSSGAVFDVSILEKEHSKACESNYMLKEFNPFPLDGTHISWLNPDSTPDAIIENDEIALHEAERRANLIVNSSLVIDLRNVEEIKMVPSTDVDILVKKAGHNVWRHNEKAEDFDATHLHKHHGLGYLDKLSDDEEQIDNCFEIVLKGGATARFQVASQNIRNEWVKRLCEISKYWVLKHQEMNLRLTKLSEHNNNEKGSFRSKGNESSRRRVKWELAGAKADTLLYSISSHALDNPVLMQSEIYKRRSDNRAFKKYFMVLSPGFLVTYDKINRSHFTGTTKPSTYCQKYSTIALSNCYAFAGDLQGEHSYSSVVNINAIINGDYGDGLPAVYEDGLRGNESMRDRVFSIWLGSKRLLIKRSKTRLSLHRNSKLQNKTTSESDEDEEEDESDDDSGSDVDSKSEFAGNEKNTGNMDVKKSDDSISKWEMMKYIGKLGAKGKVITFLARSRIERDLWVTRIKAEIERFSRNKEDDVEIL